MTFDEYGDESDPGPYPIPADAPVEHGSDHHVIVVDESTCRLYETFDSTRQPDGSWTAGSGATWDLRSNALRPAGWTSADAAGLPILAGLVRYEEVAAGRIDHAIRVTAPVTQRSYVWPARHQAGSTNAATAPPMGAWFRLRADFDTSRLDPQARVVAEALKVLENFLAAYTPGVAVRLFDTEDPELVFFGLEFVDLDSGTIPQTVELALAVTLRILRLLIGAGFHPASVHLPHAPLTPIADYRRGYGCTPVFLAPTPGFTLAKSCLAQSLRQDRLAHEAVVTYLNSITDRDDTARHSVEILVNQLLPTGTVNLPSIAQHLSMHPKTLQRRLADEGATFAEIVDTIRRERARRLLSSTGVTLSHLARELGYAEQSVLTRSCKRWFGCGPAEYRKSPG